MDSDGRSGSALQGLIGPPAVRIRPCGRLALAGAGPALMGLRGLPEDRVRKVAPVSVLRSRPAVSAAFRSSLPHRGPQTVARDLASLNLARPFRARGRRTDADHSRPALALLGFSPLQRLRSHGFGPRGPATPATFRPQRFSRSRRLTPRNPSPGLFHPGNALGVSPSGPCSTPGGRTSLEAPALLSFRSPAPQSPSARRLQSFPLPEGPYRRGPKTRRRPLPSWHSPL